MSPARWLATVFGKRKDEVFKQLKTFNIAGYYTNDWGGYERHLDSAIHQVGKRDTRKYLFLDELNR